MAHNQTPSPHPEALCPLVTLALAVLTAAAWAVEPIAIQPPPRDSGWSFALEPYLWLVRLDGELTVQGQTAPVNISDKELLKQLKVMLMLGAEVRKDRVGVFGDFFLVKVEGDGAVGPRGRVDADVKLRLLDTKFGVDYLLGPYPLAAGTNTAQVSVAPYIAGRYFYIETDISSGSPGFDVQGSHSWLDPLIGVRSVWDLSRHWNLGLAGNVGGFGVGSDLSAEGLASVGYRFRLSKGIAANVTAGYRAFYQDYSHQNFAYDATIHGPFLGVDIAF